MLYKILFSALLLLVAASPGTAQTSGDNIIVEMSKAFKRGDKARLAQLLPQARGHALEPWAAYWELRVRLGDAAPQEVQDFFSRYSDTYQEDRLRNDWLLLLGQRRDWGSFAAIYPDFRMNDDKEVRCYALLVAHLKTPSQDPKLADEVRRAWHGQREGDDGCTAAAARLVGARELSALDVWQKARLALETNRPRAAANAVQIVAPEAAGMVAELSSSPIRFLSEKKLAIRHTRKEIITLALVKLASLDSEEAAFQMDERWAVQLTGEERNWVWGLIGKQTATRMGTVPAVDALRYFAKVSKDTDLSDDMLGWMARAALRAGHQPSWPLVLQATSAMSREARNEPTWIYWRAKALTATSQPGGESRAEADLLLQSIASPRGFYEQLALEELGQKITVPPLPAPLTAQEKDAARRNPALNRGAYAVLIGLRAEGVREWNYATNLHQRGTPNERSGMTDRELLAAAQFACDREIWDRCINTSERTRSEFDFSQRFPMPFRDAVVKRAQDIALEPAYVYGLIRQESRFIMEARSGVGASGLMQVMPATAKWTANKIGLSGFTAEQINDRDTNITIGTAYLKLALDDLGGSLPMAAAAYNAGPGRPRAWRGQSGAPVLDAAVWAENVPFAETRDYVKKVLSNTTAYAAILTGQPQSLKARLGRVGPRDAALPEPNKQLP